MAELIPPSMPRPRRESLDRERGQALQASRVIFAAVGDCIKYAQGIREKGPGRPSLYPLNPFSVPDNASNEEKEAIERRRALIDTFTHSEQNPFAYVLGLSPPDAIQLREALNDPDWRNHLSLYFAGLRREQFALISEKYRNVVEDWNQRIIAPRKRNDALEEDPSLNDADAIPQGSHRIPQLK